MTPDHGTDRVPGGFAELLRRCRLAAGLTQAELAERAAVGIRTVRDLERGRASRPQRTTIELLAAALGLAGRDRADFVALARGQAGPAVEFGTGTAAPPRRLPSRGFGLPEPGELIGRDRDVADLAAMLTEQSRVARGVVSLVGLAGVGKTGLALKVAREVGDDFPGGTGGIVMIENSTVGDVLSVVATVFGVGRASDLAGRLSDAPSLLLVDAVERAPGAAAEALARLAEIAPTLRVLTTGRHPVGLAGERVRPVTPLEVPPADAPADLAVAADYPAVALLLARLRQIGREPPHPDEVAALVELVRRLGGLPLAIELAAAHGRVLNLNELLDRYGNRLLDLGAPPVAGEAVVTLRDAVAASYRLLDADERAALRRLSVLRNRWSVELAEAMLAPDPAPPDGSVGPGGPVGPGGSVPPGTSAWSVEDADDRSGWPVDPVRLLDRLLAHGLIGSRGTGPLRFRVLDVVRDFAAERATASGELAAIRRRHASVFAGLAARVAPDLAGARLVEAVGRLDEVAGDLWTALAYSANDDPHTALWLAGNLARWWRYRGRDVAGRQWLRRLLDDPRTADAEPAARAWAQVGVAQLAQEHGAGPQELSTVEAAVETFRRLADVSGELAARNVLCGVWTALGGHDEARRHGEAALELATRTGRVREMAVAQNNLTWHEIRVGDLVAARRRLAAVDRLAGECGEERLRVLARANLAEVARLEGRYADAVRQGRRVVAALADLGDPGHRRRALGTVGLALTQDGRLDEAAAVLAELRARKAGEAGPAELESEPSRPDEIPPRDDGICALIEANLATQRGDREWAAEWYAAAVRACEGSRDLRDVAEALVGLVASTDDPVARATAVRRLYQVCREGGIVLLPGERALVGLTDEEPPWGRAEPPWGRGASETAPRQSPH
ncbi:ATP-binding protein [Plantactinospora sp. WMMB782]|uniref:ATP-binding protein n=1 Tax=Plantactinospora sp. WMMB782 TaxID=3404121 RepID=UPI003B963CA7